MNIKIITNSTVSTTKNQRDSVLCKTKRSKLKQGQRGSAIFYIVLIAIALISIAVAVMVPKYQRAGAGRQFTQCQSNCRNIGTALKMYADDNEGSFPSHLSQLTPKYLRSMPMCAAARRDTYSQSYQSSTNFDSFSFYCAGHHHKWVGVEPNYPQYNSRDGLIPRR